ncbi:MAG TPA: hypothetical protein VFG33_14160 [Kribbella sp.]|uniref:hypothetical protein n=1 Tax=Kribbella sp. TaxID=1871183 RepID=UPI002D7846A0|nr:hypothetical protein [Kribbella sp.]HET6294523.1 hypothetical protein [Kribbella sp.]
MSNQSDYDRQVKDILDRVGKGHLSSDEAATLIAAVTKPTEPAATKTDSRADQAEPNGHVAQEPVADSPSASVWADVVDSPDTTATGTDASADAGAADAGASPKHAAGPAPAANGAAGVQDSVVDEAAVEGTTIDATTAEGTTAAESAGEEAPVEGTIVDEVSEAETEAEHSNVPVPAGVQRVTIRAIGRRVRLIGEPAINGVAVDGPHVIKRDGDTLAINSEGDMGVSLDGFTMLRTRSVGDLKSHVNGFAKELSIRVNPALQVEVEVTGGSVMAERLPGLTRVRVTAGTAKVTDVDGPIDLLVQAGSATLDAQITKGRSRVRVESGSATVNLRRGSDVRVHTESQLGRVSWTGAVTGQSKDVEIGRGRAALDVEVLVGTAQIASD